jgi:thiamine-monophosphate kinase
MSASEFDIIRRYFTVLNTRGDVVLGVGDDCALLSPPPGKLLAMTMDTLIAGVHFPDNTSAIDIASKSIAVNLSDLAAMGAEPAWLTLALTLPEINEEWLQEFSRTFQHQAQTYGVQLVGGDTTRGALSISVQATGFVAADRVMRRDAANLGDSIYVTGTLGDAALALRLLRSDMFAGEHSEDTEYLLSRLNRPEPRVVFAQAISACARCAIDVSDGLLADLGHIVNASHCGAQLELAALPLSSALLNIYANNNEKVDLQNVLCGGDDYELCFTVNPEFESELQQLAEQHGLRIAKIGQITDSGIIECLDQQARPVSFPATGYQHF